MQHVKLILEYDGTAYGGWQRQRGVRTVQAVLEEKLEILLRHPARTRAAGRTDAGVHAQGQVVCFHTDAALPCDRIRKGLNALLPPDIAVAGAAEAPPDFDPRRHARGKRYRYLLWNRRSRPALLRHRTWHVREPLDLAAMRAAAKALVGEHDFSAFRASGCESRTSVRVVRRLEIGPWTHPAASEAAPGGGADVDPALLAFEVEGTAFLRFMVRNLVGTLVEVGLGRIAVDAVPDILASGDRRRAGRTAPPQGLVLVGVDYGRDPSA
jgi:tRNA pseudouridine38-40 synthase